MRGRAATAALLLLLVVVLVAAVAVAATGTTTSGTGATRSPSESLYDSAFTLLLIGVALGGLLLLYGLAQRKAIAAEIATGKYRRTSAAMWLVGCSIFAALFYWGLVRMRPPEASGEEGELAFPNRPELPTEPGRDTPAPYEPGVSWIPIVVVAALALAAIAAYVLAERRSKGGRRESELLLAERLAAVLDDTLDDIRAEVDPRRAIIACYARLEDVLAANGAPRVASETPDEYLARVLHELEIDPGAVGRLTDLYTRVKFSPHAVGVAMKDDAIAALEQTRDELGSLREAARHTALEGGVPLGAAS